MTTKPHGWRLAGGTSRWAATALFVLVAPAATAACAPSPGAPTTPAAPTAPAPTAPGGSQSPGADDAHCTAARPTPDAVCVRDCGPPVARADDPPPGWSWLSRADADSRTKYGCPICLPRDARIATPFGDRMVHELQVGMPIFTVDATGARVVARVEAVGSTVAPRSHKLTHVVLDDGRELRASPGHPLGDGRTIASLRAGDRLDGARVVDVELVALGDLRTYDVLPSGQTRAYWADGVLVASTLSARPESGRVR